MVWPGNWPQYCPKYKIFSPCMQGAKKIFLNSLFEIFSFFQKIYLKNEVLNGLLQYHCYKLLNMKYFILAIKKAFDFRSRSTRPEYWYFFLFNIIFFIAAMIIDRVLGTTFKMDVGYGEQDLGYGYVYVLFAVAMMIPGLSAGVRRLHDIGKSGWMMLVSLIPVAGTIWLIVLLAKDSQPGENKWGPNPNNVPLVDGDLLRM